MKKIVLTVVLLAMAISSFAADAAPARRKIVDQSFFAMQTIASLRSLRTSVEAYYSDHKRYPAAATLPELVPMIQPTYIRTAPEKDAWGTPIIYRVSADGQSYVLSSAGSDHTFDESGWNKAGFPTSSKEDAVYKPDFVKEWLIQNSCD
jgi:hypothetical protein